MSLLTTFQFPRPISSLAWDLTERLFFAASADGHIHQVNLFKKRDDKLSRVMEAVGGAGSADVIRISDEDQQAARKRLIVVGYVCSFSSLHPRTLIRFVANLLKP